MKTQRGPSREPSRSVDRSYFATTSDVQRAAYLAASDMLNAITESGTTLTLILFIVVTFAIAAGVRRARMVPSWVFYLTIASGVTPIVHLPLPSLRFLGLPNIPLTSLYFCVVGVKLYNWGPPPTDTP